MMVRVNVRDEKGNLKSEADIENEKNFFELKYAMKELSYDPCPICSGIMDFTWMRFQKEGADEYYQAALKCDKCNIKIRLW